jgi:hypothetical protein
VRDLPLLATFRELPKTGETFLESVRMCMDLSRQPPLVELDAVIRHRDRLDLSLRGRIILHARASINLDCLFAKCAPCGAVHSRRDSRVSLFAGPVTMQHSECLHGKTH